MASTFVQGGAMASRLLLIRHAETDAARRKLFVGSTDVPASAVGLEKLERMVTALTPYAPEQWYCSPLKRARQTAAQMNKYCLLEGEMSVDDRLREIDFGRWEMRSFTEIAMAEPDHVEDWARYDDFVFPEGESVAGFRNRVADVFSALQRLPVKEVGIVTHGGVIRTMICLALGLAPKQYLLFNVKPGSLTVLDLYSEGGVLSALNV